MDLSTIVMGVVIYVGIRAYDKFAATRGLPQLPAPAAPIPGMDDLVTKILDRLFQRVPALHDLPTLAAQVRLLSTPAPAPATAPAPFQAPLQQPFQANALFASPDLAAMAQPGLGSQQLSTQIPITLFLRPVVEGSSAPRADAQALRIPVNVPAAA